MIFYFNADGTPKTVLPESVVRGSSNANSIYFVSPVCEQNMVNVAFKLPDGTVTEKFFMNVCNGALDGVLDKDGNTFSVWTAKIPTIVTACHGTVGVQFYFTNILETVATALCTFEVLEGIISETPTVGDDYLEIMQFLSGLSAKVDDSVLVSNTAQGVVENVNDKLNTVEHKVSDLYAFALDTTVGQVTAESKYSIRTTADGLNIVDGARSIVKRISGGTVKSVNLIPSRKANVIDNGITYILNDDGSVTANGTATAVSSCYFTSNLNLGAGTYFLSGCPLGGNSNSTYNLTINVNKNGVWNRAIIDTGNGVIANVAEDETLVGCFIWVNGGQKFDNVTFKPMLTVGTERVDYSPYFSDLKNSYFKGIESTGRNLFNPTLYDGIKINSDGSVTTSKYVGNVTPVTFQGCPNTDYSICVYNENKEIATNLGSTASHKVSTYCNGVWVNSNNSNAKFRTDEYGLASLMIGSASYDTANRYKNYIAIYKGNIAVSDTPPYEPYVLDGTFALDTAIELGLYDYIDVVNKKIVRQTGYLTKDTVFTDDELTSYTDYVLSLNGLNLAYKLDTATQEDVSLPVGYVCYKNGSEKIVQGDVDNSKYGGINTVVQNYYVKIGE